MSEFIHFSDLECNALMFDDYVAIESFSIDLDRRECRLVLDGALWLLAEPRWLGPGELCIRAWTSARARRMIGSASYVDYPINAAFLIDHLRQLNVTAAGVRLEGDGSTVDALYFDYDFAGASIVGRFESDDRNVPEGSKRFFPRHELGG